MQTDDGLPTAVVEHEALNPAADSEVATRPLVLLDDLCRVHGDSHDIPGLCPAVFHSGAAQPAPSLPLPRQPDPSADRWWVGRSVPAPLSWGVVPTSKTTDDACIRWNAPLGLGGDLPRDV